MTNQEQKLDAQDIHDQLAGMKKPCDCERCETFACQNCGPMVAADEDGCCTSCGADTTVGHNPSCSVEGCHGTGKVLMFRELSEECLKCGARWGHKPETDCCMLPHGSSQDNGCHGTGLVSKEAHLETIMDSFLEAEFITLISTSGIDLWHVHVYHYHKRHLSGTAEGKAILLTTLQATLKAVEATQEKRLPSTSDIRGIDPNWTGGKKSEDYIRELRGDDE